MYRFLRDAQMVSEAQDIIDKMEGDQTVLTNILCQYKALTTESSDRHEYYRKIVDDMVNDMSFEDDKMAEMLANNHPTLQQNFMRLCLKFITLMAQKSSGDGRNDASIRMAKKFMEAIGDDRCLPYV